MFYLITDAFVLCHLALCWVILIIHSEQKIGFFSRFIGEKSVFGRHGNDFDKRKLEEKNRQKIEENSQFFAEKSEKSYIFPKFPIFPLAPKI